MIIIGTGTGGAPEQLLPQQNYWGATSTSCSPNFFCNLQLNVTLQTFNTKILENSFAPDAIVQCVYLFRKIHTAQSYTLNLDWIGLSRA